MKRSIWLWLMPLAAWSAPADVRFEQSAKEVPAYEYVEVTLAVTAPDVANPFTGAAVTGEFGLRGATRRLRVEGFCDATDGSTYRIRFMPPQAGDYDYTVRYRQGTFERSYQGSFQARAAGRRGPVRIDPAHPWHFVWEGTGEHYYFNGTTAFWLMGWRDEETIRFSLERFQRLKVNRVRVLLAGAAPSMWGEKVITDDNFTIMLRPWEALSPESLERPDIDYTRFNLPYWQKWERMMRFARERDLVISVIFDIASNKAHPLAGSEDERRYFRYAVARLAAFPNLTWDLGDDIDGYRDEVWTHATGTALMGWDPYQHLATSHPAHCCERQDRGSAWFGFTSLQEWSRRQHELMLSQREVQKKTGRIIPQTNEEYGYEDHYPRWAPRPEGESAEALRRVAWDIAMAGAYGTAGESCRQGTNVWPDTGGGWVNGRGDDQMTMLNGYAHILEFFHLFEWWNAEPHDELVSRGDYCLAQPGRFYAIYLPEPGKVTVTLEPGRYKGTWFRAATGQTFAVEGPIEGPQWTSPPSPGMSDWALLLERER